MTKRVHVASRYAAAATHGNQRLRASVESPERLLQFGDCGCSAAGHAFAVCSWRSMLLV
jgi:hypothetical protein